MSDDFSDFPRAADDFSDFPAAPNQSATPAATTVPTSDSKSPTLQLGLGTKNTTLDTHIPIPQMADDALAGFGRGAVKVGQGLKQAGVNVGNKLGMVSDDTVSKTQSNIDATNNEDLPFMHTKAGKFGQMAAEVAPMALMPEAGIVGSALKGAALGAVAPVATGEAARVQNATLGAMGGAGGAAVGKVLGAALSGFGGSGGRKAAVDILTNEGIPLSAAQKTGAKLAQHVERASAMTGDAPAEFVAQQGAAFNRAALKRIGVNDPEVTAATPKVLEDARKNITNVMDDVATRNHITYDSQLESDLADIEHNASRQVPEHDLGPIHTNLDDILTGASRNNGVIDGALYQRLNSNLGKLSRDPKVGEVASDMHEAINDALQRSANPDDIAALAKARQEYRALKQIEPATDFATGNISVPKLANELAKKQNRNQSLYGKGDQSLTNLVRAAKHVMPDTLGNSGTAERSIPAFTAIEALGSGEPVKAGAKLATGKLGLDAAGKAMRNQGAIGKYVTSGVPGVRKIAPLSQAAAPLGYGLADPADRDTNAVARASGGKVDKSGATVDKEALVNRLIHRWKQAKKATDATTKPLLNQPDAAIVRALDIAQAHI